MPDFATLKPVDAPSGPDFGSLKPADNSVGNVPPAADNAQHGLAYKLSSGLIQTLDKPILKFAALAPQALNAIRGDQAAVDKGKTEGYDFGFFGNAKPIGANIDVTKAPWSEQNLRSIADIAGTSLEAASYAIPAVGEEVAAGATATEGALGKAADFAKGFVKTPLRTVATLQGGGVAGQEIGKGDDPLSATGKGVVAGLTSAIGMGIMDSFGNKLGTWGSAALRTQAGQVFVKKLGEVGQYIKKVVEPSAVEKIAGEYKTNYNVAQEQVNHALSNFLGDLRSKLSLPNASEWIPSMLKQMGTKLNAMKNATEKKYNDVWGSGVTFPSASHTVDAMKDAYAEIGNASKVKIPGMAPDKLGENEVVGAHNAPNLHDFLSEVKERVIDPIAKGGEFSIRELNTLMHFTEVAGSKAEVGIATKVRTALYKDIEEGLKSQGEHGEQILTRWNAAKEESRQASSLARSSFVKVWKDMRNPQQVGTAFLEGKLLGDATNAKELESLIGQDGIGALRATIMHSALGRAIDKFSTTVRFGVPASYDEARKAASSELQKFIDQTDSVGLSGFNALSAQQTAWIKGAQTMIEKGEISHIISSMGLPNLGEVSRSFDMLERGRATFEAASTPSKFAESIQKMTSLKDVQAALSFLKTPEDKAFVGTNIIKNFLTKATSAISKGADTKDWAKVIEGITNLGGNDKEGVFNELFGKSPETAKLVSTLDTMVKSLGALGEVPEGSKLGAAGHATAAFVLALMHHPILATGQASMAAREMGARTTADFESFSGKTEDEIFKGMEQDGELTITGVQKVMRLIGRGLKDKFAQFSTGEAVSHGVGDILSPETNQ